MKPTESKMNPRHSPSLSNSFILSSIDSYSPEHHYKILSMSFGRFSPSSFLKYFPRINSLRSSRQSQIFTLSRIYLKLQSTKNRQQHLKRNLLLRLDNSNNNKNRFFQKLNNNKLKL